MVKRNSDAMQKYRGKLVSSSRDDVGEVYRPPLPCRALADKKYERYFKTNDFVGRVYNDRQKALATFRNEDFLKDFDPKHYFTHRSKGVCAIDMEFGDLDHILPADHSPKPKYKAQLIYPFLGDTPFSTDLVPKDRYAAFATAMLFFVKNVAQMNERGIFHFNIRNENIAYDSAKNRLFLLDYYMLSKEATVFVSMASVLWDQRYENNKWKSNRPIISMSPEANFISSLAETKIICDEADTKNKMSEDRQLVKSNTMRVPYLFGALFKDDRLRDRLLELFKKSAKWYKKQSDDVLLQTINNEFYKRLHDAIDQSRSWERNDALLQKLFNSRHVMQRQDSWGLGTVLLQWTGMLLVETGLPADVKSFLDDFFYLVSNSLVVYDILIRQTAMEFYENTVTLLEKKYPDIYQRYSTYVAGVMDESARPNSLLNSQMLNITKIYLKKKAQFKQNHL